MNKKSLAILLAVAGGFASSAYATNPINKLMTKHASSHHALVKNNKSTKQNDQPYTDFTGSWVGNCGDGENMTIEIENGDNFINLSGIEYRIGKGLQGTYQSNEEQSEHEHSSFEWNKDGSELIMKSVYVFKENMDSSAIDTGVNKFVLKMKNGQLNLEGKFVFLNDITPSQTYNVSCVFSKSDNKHSH